MNGQGLAEDVVAEVDRAAGQRAGVRLGVEHPQPVLERVGDRAAGGQLDDQGGALAQRRHGVPQPAEVERGPGVVVADVDVDQAGAGRLAGLARSPTSSSSVTGSAGASDLAVSAPVGATVISVRAGAMPGIVSRPGPTRRRSGDRGPGSTN